MEPGRRWIEQYGTRRGIVMVAAVFLAFIGVALVAFGPPALVTTGQWSVLRQGRFRGTIDGGGVNGEETHLMFARSGETLVLEYKAEVEDGLFYIIIRDAVLFNRRLLFLPLEGAHENRIEIPIPKTRLYDVEVDYAVFHGRYDIAWEVR